ncbi:hypothetical protein [Blastopirellula marina]|uniref:Uncharacterized protein n=1 Tax=Blastopirellula marina DSM 3645 TaxID=314230 RepID=A3ZZ04_9BACT|nr:hypothetical protein [Blastopirellula marina]EAQ78252.1 hypothetical protein DSM3645_17986 [Blastopirellula marina DSM 3645]
MIDEALQGGQQNELDVLDDPRREQVAASNQALPMDDACKTTSTG